MHGISSYVDPDVVSDNVALCLHVESVVIDAAGSSIQRRGCLVPYVSDSVANHLCIRHVRSVMIVEAYGVVTIRIGLARAGAGRQIVEVVS